MKTLSRPKLFRRRKFAVTLSVLTVFSLALFQNCFQTKFTAAKIETTNSSSTPGYTGGDGYDGKTFISLSPNVCASDGGIADTRITIKNSIPYIVREHCVDLAPALIRPVADAELKETSIELRGTHFNLESVPPLIDGVAFHSEIGDYAPAVFRQLLGEGSAAQGVTLADGFILTVRGTSTFPLSADNLVADLFSHSGMSVSKVASAGRAISGIEMGIDYNPFPDLFPIGEHSAVLVTIIKDGTGAGFYKFVLITHDGDALTISPASADIVIPVSTAFGGHPVDASRFLMWYFKNPSSSYAFRVMSLNAGSLSLGPETVITDVIFPEDDAPAIVPVNNAGKFRVVRGVRASATAPVKLGSYTVSVSGENVIYNNDVTTAGFAMEGPINPLIVGNFDQGLLTFQTPDPMWETVMVWGYLEAGRFAQTGATPVIAKTPRTMNTAGTTNLYVGGKYFARLGIMGERVAYFDSPTSQAKFYNLSLVGFYPKFFGVLTQLAVVEIDNGTPVLLLLSVPKP